MQDIRELVENLDIGEYGDFITDYNRGYICDIIQEIADNEVDIYTSDLLEFAKNHYEYIEQAVNEGLVDTSKFDFLGAIRSGEYLYISEDLNSNVDDIILYKIYKYILDDLKIVEITDEQADEILLIDIDTNNRLENVLEDVNNIFENSEK